MASRRTSGPRGSSGLRHELLDLANHLRQERLFVQSEKLQVNSIHEGFIELFEINQILVARLERAGEEHRRAIEPYCLVSPSPTGNT